MNYQWCNPHTKYYLSQFSDHLLTQKYNISVINAPIKIKNFKEQSA